ncbi:MAG: TonB-dependent receptor [Acidobacteria bacterium]|nr:MAG: TonB-dependent receptor [Acidobacteriota bacterium]
MRQVLFAISPAVVTLRRTLATLFLVLLVASPALAQTGQINGVITDNTGGVVPGATVKAVEVATGLSRDTVTGADGRYTFTSLRPTTYDITAELTGFRASQRKGVLLQANQNLTVNFAVELGALSETVTVAGQSSTVDVTSATLSEVVDSKRIVELPLNGRDAAKLSTLVAGMVLTQVDQESGKTIPGALRMSTNGTESRQVSFRLDGTSHSDPYFQQNQPFPFPDALQEFSIQTSNYSAAQGNSAGAVVNAVTRSGTNNLHGGTFGYLRDRTFNARNFFAADKDFLKRKQYGGYAGGPIQHNKTFFFAGWQGTNIANRGTNLVQFAPTTDERNGNFATCGSACNKPLTDPLTGQPFPGNQIPVARFDPAAVNVLKYIPAVGGDGLMQVPRLIGQDDNQVVVKVDQQLRQSDQIGVRYFIDHFTNDPTFTEGNLLSYRNPTLQSRVRAQNVVGSWTRTMTNTSLNELRVGFNRMHSRRFPPTNNVPSMQDLGVRLPIYPDKPSISQIEANGFFNIGDNLEASFVRNGLELNDRFTWVKGKHSIQVGGEAQNYTVTIRNQFRRAGHFTFDGSRTGHPIADFLLGYVQTFDQGTGEYKDYNVWYGSSFVQDDFKVSQKLTVNLGLRYESSPPWHEKVGRIEQFTLQDFNNNVRSTVFPQAPRGELFRGDPGVAEDGTDPASNNLGARTGFAWALGDDGKTSLRGGGGMFYDQHRDGESGNGAVNAPPWSLRLAVIRPAGPFSDPYRGRTDFSLITDATIGTQQAPFPLPVLIETLDTTYKTPLTYNYNLTLERELMQGLMARAAYVGSHSVNGRRTVQLDPSVYTPGDTRGTDMRRLFAAAGIGQVNQQRQDRESIYNGMQLTISKRYSRGFTVTSNYTLSKVEGNFGDDVIPYNEFTLDKRDPLVWGPLFQDHRHRFTTSWVLDLPGGSMAGPVKWVLGGWQWSGVMEYQTGQPFNIISGSDRSQRGLASTTDRAKLTGQPLTPPAGSDPLLWFNPAAFTVADIGTFGDVPKGFLYGPSLHTWNMGLFKNFRHNNDVNIQFRVELFNIFNQVNFDIPGTTPVDNRIAANSANFGRITRTVPVTGDPRIIQLGLKFVF